TTHHPEFAGPVEAEPFRERTRARMVAVRPSPQCVTSPVCAGRIDHPLRQLCPDAAPTVVGMHGHFDHSPAVRVTRGVEMRAPHDATPVGSDQVATTSELVRQRAVPGHVGPPVAGTCRHQQLDDSGACRLVRLILPLEAHHAADTTGSPEGDAHGRSAGTPAPNRYGVYGRMARDWSSPSRPCRAIRVARW